MTLDVVTGEVMPNPRQPLTPEEAEARAEWVREMQRSVLVAGTDYAKVGNATKPTLLKSGAEMLCLASASSFTVRLMDDDDYAQHRGVRYKCEVLHAGTRAAECEGYAGYDERRFAKGNWRADWNTLVKMAQKRAFVGATLLAHAASGLFVADVEDDRDEDKTAGHTTERADPAGSATGARSGSVPPEPPVGIDGTDALVARLRALSSSGQSDFRKWRESQKLTLPPMTPDTLAAMVAEVDAIEARANEERESYYRPGDGSPYD
jgi:hypothetical protein